MKNLLNQLNKVVNQVQSHHANHQCSIREHAAINSTICDLNNLAKEHKEKLQSLPAADPFSEKKLKHLYRSYQTTLVRLLNKLYKFQSTCQVNREKEICLKRKAIKTLTELLCFLREQYPHAFDTTLNIPSSVYQTQKEQLQQSLTLIKSMLITKRVNRLLLKIVTHPITDFLDNNKEHYTFSDLTYLHSWMNKLAIVCTKSHTSRELNKLICISTVEHDLNSNICFDFYVEFMSKEYHIQDTRTEQLETLNFYLKCVKQVYVTSNVSFDLNKKKLKSALANWLKQEIEYITNSCHINENNQQQSVQLELSSKLLISESVASLAYLTKLFVDTGFIITQNKEETIRFFSNNFSTNRADTISQRNFRTRYFNPDDAAISATKDIILKWLNALQKQ